MAVKIELIDNKKIWENFVLSRQPNIFLQSWNWGKFQQSLGKKIFRLGFWKRNQLVGVALLIKEEAKRGTYLTCPGGPLLNWEEKELFYHFRDYLKELGKLEKAFFARVRPSIPDLAQNRELFQKAGFIKAPMHLHAETTLHLDLNRSEEEIISGMRKNTRYCLRKAAKSGVEVEISKDAVDINKLYQLQLEVVKRRSFTPFSKEFFRKHFLAFVDDDQIALIKALHQGETLAIGMFVFYGDTVFYHYSGSSLKYPSVFASYAMLWQAIKEGKRRGCRLFDFWGIAPKDDPRHRFAGVTTFKKGFGGQRVDWLPAQDLSLDLRYWPIFAFETYRRLSRRL